MADALPGVGPEGRYRDLGPVSCDALRDAVARLDEAAWTEQEYRQEAFNVHRSTHSVVLRFIDLDRWPRIAVSRDRGWPRLGAVAEPVIGETVAAAYPEGGRVIRAMAVRLAAGARIAPHVDRHESLVLSHRVHVPLLTNPRVRFFIDGVPHRFEAGRAVEINNQLSHSVMNDGATDRVHLIFDYLPPGRLAAPDLARAGAP